MKTSRDNVASFSMTYHDSGNDNATIAIGARNRQLYEEQIRQPEIAHIDQVMNQNNDLIAKAQDREKVIASLSDKITQLMDINKAQAQKIEELKLENENLLSMCGDNQAKPNTPTLSSPRI